MPGTRRGALFRRGCCTRLAILLAVALAIVAMPVAEVAGSPPAKGQYVLPSPSAGAGHGKGQNGHRTAVPASATGSADSDAALPILLVGFGAIGTATGVIIYRKRRKPSGESE
jgi:hypothetical protein